MSCSAKLPHHASRITKCSLKSRVQNDIPLLLPANLKAASVRIMPNTSWDSTVVTFPWVGSGRWMVSREPDAVTICCSFVPANCPRIACVIDVGGCIVSEYMNMLEVAAIFPESTAPQLTVLCKQLIQSGCSHLCVLASQSS